jgi:hypothetical protein
MAITPITVLETHQMIDLSVIVYRPCMPHITECKPLMTLMTGRYFVEIDISRL